LEVEGVNMPFGRRIRNGASRKPYSYVYGIGKYLVNRVNIRGIEKIEKTKLARIN